MIYHIANRKDWDDSKPNGKYKTGSLVEEGFIHCSPLEKLEETADKFFKGQFDLVILCIDEKKVTPDIIYEDLYNSNYKFPHIYGLLNTNAVVDFIETNLITKETIQSLEKSEGSKLILDQSEDIF
ncbi:MAG: DUF952 domain-containing protein [Ignavibacteria bacterium]